MKKLVSMLLALLLLSSCSQGKEGEAETTAADDNRAEAEFTIDLSNADDYSKNGAAEIVLGSQISVKGSGAGVSGSTVTIAEGGTYIVSGSGEGCIVVEANKKADVYIVLNSVNLKNPAGPAIMVTEADNVYLVCENGTESTLSDGSSYEVYAGDSTADAAVFSKSDLTVSGGGKLSIYGNYKHGILSKDDLVIGAVKLYSESKSTSVGGKDSVQISGADIKIIAGTNGICSDNSEDETKGYVFIENSKISLDAGTDGIQAKTKLNIKSGEFDITAGGGSKGGLSSSSDSYKGLKAGGDITVSGGTFNISTRDDGIHSNNDVTITDGKFTISSGDDGIHGDNKLTVKGGELKITKSYEGLEATYLEISGGKHSIKASDDGLNAAGGNDGSGGGNRPGRGGFLGSVGEIIISGGYMVIDADGDGIDSNGTIAMSGGEVYVSGPESSGNGAFDYDKSASVTGGTLVALGSSGMAQGFSLAENQGAILVSFQTQSGGKFSVEDEDGNEILSFECSKKYASAAITAPQIQKGKTYKIICDGTVVATVEMTDNIYGSSQMMPGGMNPGGGRPDGFGSPGGFGRPDGFGGDGGMGSPGDFGGHKPM